MDNKKAYINYKEQFVVLDGVKYTIDDLKQKQVDAVDFNNCVCNIKNMLRYVKLRSILASVGKVEVHDPSWGIRKYGFVKIKSMYLDSANMHVLADVANVADDFLISGGTVTAAVYNVWEDEGNED